MADYSRQIASVKRQIATKGATIQFQTAVAGSIDTPFADDAAPLPTVLVGMLSINAGLARYYKFKVSKDEDRQDGTLLLLMTPDAVPQYRSSFVWPDGATYYVKSFDVLAPSGEPILYFLEATQ